LNSVVREIVYDHKDLRVRVTIFSDTLVAGSQEIYDAVFMLGDVITSEHSTGYIKRRSF